MTDYICEVVLKDENSAPLVQNGAEKKGDAKKNGQKNGKIVPALNSVSAQEAAASLIDLALAEQSTDNISAVIVKYL